MASVCPPEGSTNTEWTQVGPVQVFAVWTADATPYPNCDGDIVSVRVLNTGTTTWSARIPSSRKPQGRLVSIAAGDDRTFNRAQCVSNGYEKISDLRDLLLTLG